ncbi:NlpC/P60 family protein [Lolliginicoccus suaedae]|uniref:NlpC/P60 family protein n=1 Tax=Lolliginicoccus suaedae TaxID=2605429 RepID=UPI0011EDDB08|nr:NlpC/P60 family protein [Lolliginicoccus suaedae]
MIAGSRRALIAMVLATLVLAGPIGLTGTLTASADPIITDSTEALNRLSELSRAATKANDDVLVAEEELSRLQDELAEAEARQEGNLRTETEASSRIETLQVLVDAHARANYRGTRVDPIYALLTSDSPQSVITRMSALDVITRDTGERVKDFRSARETFKRAAAEAATTADQLRDLAATAAARRDELERHRASLEQQIAEIKELFETLTAEERAEWAGAIIPPGFDAGAVRGSGTGAAIVKAALTRLGRPYVWGATGPEEFDCSGLVMWAHNQAGRSVPRTSQMQAVGGMPVSPSEIQPGDVITYYSDASHVGLYIGDGQIVHASTFGVPVKVDTVNNAPIHSIRRY